MKTIATALLLLLTSIFSYAQHALELFPFRDKSGFVGYCLADGTAVIKPQFFSATGFTEGYYIVVQAEYEKTGSEQRGNHIPNTEKYALLDSTAHYIIDFNQSWDYIGIDNGFIMVLKDGKMGIINNKNKLLIPTTYEMLQPINKSLIVAHKDDKTGVINIQNNIIIPFIYDNIYSVTPVSQNYYAIVNTDEKYGVIDQQGKYIIAMNPIQLHMLTPTSIVFEENGSYGLCDYGLKTILPAIYMAPSYDDQVLGFSKGSTIYYFTNEGKLIRTAKLEFSSEKIPH